MFEVFKFKSKTTEEIPKKILINTTDQLEIVVDDSDLDLGDLENLVFTYYLGIYNR